MKKLQGGAILGISISVGMMVGLIVGIIIGKVPVGLAIGFMLGTSWGNLIRMRVTGECKVEKWSEMSRKKKIIQISLIIILAILVVLGTVFYFQYK
jgi:F0F1-type ATP synthase assembly protein I